MASSVMILNGPNLNLLGVRQPEIYGTTTLAEIEAACRDYAAAIGLGVSFHQSNHEGQLVDWVQEARGSHDAVVINPAGTTFTSLALMDALQMFEGPIIELHISNIHAREPIYHNSLVSPVATAVICGLGAAGYLIALQAVAQRLGALPEGAPSPRPPWLT